MLPIIKYEFAPKEGTTGITAIADGLKNDEGELWRLMKNSNNFRLLFDYIFPIQRILSMLVIKDTLNFEQSKEGLPAHILEENEQFFKDAKKLLYSLIDEAAVTSRDPVLKSVISALAEDSVGDVARMIEKINSLS